MNIIEDIKAIKRIIYNTKKGNMNKNNLLEELGLALLSHARHLSEISLQINVGAAL